MISTSSTEIRIPHQRHLDTRDLDRDLRLRTVAGSVAVAGAQILKFGVTIGTALVMARLLTPSDFGLVAMATGVIGLLSVFKDAGLSTATVQREDITQEQVSNLFWVNIALSGALTIAVALASRAVAWFYADPRLTAVVLWLSVTFILNGASVQHLAILNRQMQFTSLARIEVTALVVSSVIGVCAAMLRVGHWSLVFASVSLEVVTLVLAWSSSSWRPSRATRTAGTGELLRFGASLASANFFLTIVGNLDVVLIGRFYDAAAAGLYSRANALLMRPINQLVPPLTTVVVPMLSRLQDRPEQYRRTFLLVFEAMALTTFPVSALMFALARPGTLLLLGPKWEGAVPIFQAFSLAAVYLPFAAASRWLFITQGRGRDALTANAAVAAVTAASIVAAIPFGPVAVAAAFSITGCFIRLPLLLWFAGRSGPVTPVLLWSRFVRYLPLWIVVAVTAQSTVSWAHLSSHFIQVISAVSASAAAGALLFACDGRLRSTALALGRQARKAVVVETASQA